MTVEKFGIEFLEYLFAVGLAGSAILIVLTSIEDVREVFAREDNPDNVAETD